MLHFEGSLEYSSKSQDSSLPQETQVTNSKHLDNIIPMLADQIDNDSFGLLLRAFTTSFHILCKTLLLHQVIHPEGLARW